jgi:predicted short-subunit dehydrogenase-like oxidoreductase (DUF2520 family)
VPWVHDNFATFRTVAEHLNVSIIGSGNLAWHLAPALDNAGYVVKEVYSRNARHAESLTSRLYQAEVRTSLDFSASPSRIFIIAVTDEAITEVATEIILPDNAHLIHTSGSQPLSVLQFAAIDNIGSLYPLQTFSKGKKVDFRTVPLFVESSQADTEKILLALAKAISNKVSRISAEERKALHLAACIAADFTVHMMTISYDLLKKNKMSFDLIKPLITETINKGLALGPEQAQAGPARNGDLETLDRHLGFLADDPAVAEIYKMVSQHIIDRHEED